MSNADKNQFKLTFDKGIGGSQLLERSLQKVVLQVMLMNVFGIICNVTFTWILT